MPQAIASLLDERHAAGVRALWDELRQKTGAGLTAAEPVPHFSWHVAQRYDTDHLAPALGRFSANQPAFPARTGGLLLLRGGGRLVLALSLVRDPRLTSFHRALLPRVRPHAVEEFRYCGAETWIPHVTLADDNLTADSAAEAVRLLADRDFTWPLEVRDLTLLTSDATDGTSPMLRFVFRREEAERV